MSEHRMIPPGWNKRVDHGFRMPGPGRVHTLHYPDGSIRVEHTCKAIGEAQLVTAPALRLDGGHVVQQEDPLTITPSILCPDCGLHGFIISGKWI